MSLSKIAGTPLVHLLCTTSARAGVTAPSPSAGGCAGDAVREQHPRHWACATARSDGGKKAKERLVSELTVRSSSPMPPMSQ